MSDIAKGLYTKLQATSGVTDIVGSRAYADAPTKNNPELPFYVYRTSTYDPTYHTGGRQFAQAVVEVECVADTSAEAESLRNAIITAVDNYRGTMGAETVTGCNIETKTDTYLPPVMGENRGWHVHAVDFRISFLES